MMNIPIRLFLGLALSLAASSLHADRVADPSSSGYTIEDINRSLHSQPIVSAKELTCALEKVKVDPAVAQRTAEGCTQALRDINFPADKFNLPSLLNFLAQSSAESNYGANLTQDGLQAYDKKGYGVIQVTGIDNLRACKKCMNEITSNLGEGVDNNPETIIGDSSKDSYKSCLCSLCWWKENMINNEEHNRVTLDLNHTKEVTQCVNGGGIGHKITDGDANVAKRQKALTEIQQGLRQCQSTSASL
jgi:predicted chitinase